jgi:hypothetical protein
VKKLIAFMLTANAAGAYLNDEIKTADEGSFALIAAALHIVVFACEAFLIERPSVSRCGNPQRNDHTRHHHPLQPTHPASPHPDRARRADPAAPVCRSRWTSAFHASR